MHGDKADKLAVLEGSWKDVIDLAVRENWDEEELCYSCYCDVVYYCETTKLIDVMPAGEVVDYKNEPFRFALKGDKLVVQKGGSLLGDGTANWDIIGGCAEDNGRPFLNSSSARMFGGSRWLRFSDGAVRGADLTFNVRSRVWFAKCDTFE